MWNPPGHQPGAHVPGTTVPIPYAMGLSGPTRASVVLSAEEVARGLAATREHEERLADWRRVVRAQLEALEGPARIASAMTVLAPPEAEAYFEQGRARAIFVQFLSLDVGVDREDRLLENWDDDAIARWFSEQCLEPARTIDLPSRRTRFGGWKAQSTEGWEFRGGSTARSKILEVRRSLDSGVASDGRRLYARAGYGLQLTSEVHGDEFNGHALATMAAMTGLPPLPPAPTRPPHAIDPV